MAATIGPGIRPLLAACDALPPEAAKDLGNPAWDSARGRILIARLSPFADVDRSSPHLVLFSECREALPGAFIDFAFFPSRRDRESLEERSLPWFHGLASGRPPSDFDLVMVSLSFGLELVNLPYLFSTAGLPLSGIERARAREAGTMSPIVILGGSSAAASGALVSPAGDCMVDGIFLGEGEAGAGSAAFGAIGELGRLLCDRDEPAAARLERARGVEGFWIPGAPEAPSRRVARPSPRPLVSYPVLNSAEASTARLQITAGCPGLCSFCLEGWDRRPYRELPLEEILAAARELRVRSGADSLEVYSFNFNTHSRIFELLFELNRVFRRVNLMSQRLDLLAATRGLAAAELAADKRSFTLGIEGVSGRMRAYYRKGLEEGDIEAAVEALAVRGVRELKLFYIISGIEDEEDLAEFAAFAAALAARREAAAPHLRVLASAGYLVRLPSTPLQYAPLALDEERLGAIAEAMRISCEGAGIEFRLATHFDEYCVEQLLALGGPAVHAWLAGVPALGFRYDGSLSKGAWPSLRAWAARAGLLEPSYLGEKDASWTPCPALAGDEVLRAHYEAAKAFADRASCLGAGCSDCGACPEPSDRAAIGRHRAPLLPDAGYIDRLTRLIAAKAAFPTVLVEVGLPASLAGATPEYRSSWLLRRLSAASPGAEKAVFEAKERLFSAGALEGLLPPGFTGRCVFSLSGPSPDKARTAARAAGFAPLDALPDIGRIEVEVELPPPWSGRALPGLRAWLEASGLSFVERREEGRRLLEPAARDARKRILISASVEEAATFRALLSLGPKARLPAWLEALGPRAVEASRVAVLGYSA